VSNEQVFALDSTSAGARKLVGESMIHLGSWNVGSLTGKLRELVDTVIRRRVNILCIQETKWTGKERSRNGVGILIDKRLKNRVVAVRRQGDMIKLFFRDLVLNVISVYASQVGLSDNVKRQF
jgi:exonuclease III